MKPIIGSHSDNDRDSLLGLLRDGPRSGRRDMRLLRRARER